MRNFYLSCLVLLAVASTALATPPPRPTRGEPVTIKSDTLHADNEKRTATFEGKVVARQGDLTLYADRLVISYSERGHEMTQAEAFGNVRIIQADRQGSSSHAIYYPDSGRITMDGKPKVLQGDDVVTGKVITYFVDEQRSEVTGGPKERVEAVIHPRGKNAGAKP